MINLYIKTIIFLLTFLVSYSAVSQSLDGLKGVVSSHQEKISTIEDTLKDLRGTIEEQSNNTKTDQDNKVIEAKIDLINETIKLLKNKINNITNLAYDLEFSLKRIERHLELSSIKNKIKKEDENVSLEVDPSFKKKEKIKINKKSLSAKTNGVLGFIQEAPNNDVQNTQKKIATVLPKGSANDHFNFALDAALKGDFLKAENAFKEFLITHKKSKKQADAQYWLGRVYYTQKKYEEAAIALAEFNSIFPNDSRFQETTLLIAEAAVNFAPKRQLCDILTQSLEFMINPSEKFKTRLNFLKNEKQCPSE